LASSLDRDSLIINLLYGLALQHVVSRIGRSPTLEDLDISIMGLWDILTPNCFERLVELVRVGLNKPLLRSAGLSAPASQADDSEQNTTEEQQETDDQLVADLEDTVESALAARNKGLNPEASQSNEPQQMSTEKAQDSGSEVVAALQSSSEDQRANRDKVSNPSPSAPNECEGNRIEALQNHDCEIVADP
jgi:hypothetical protein